MFFDFFLESQPYRHVEYLVDLIAKYQMDYAVIPKNFGNYYGVATVSRIDKMIGLFCRILALL